MEQELDFENWFELFTKQMRKRGHSGPLDQEAFEDDYEEGKSPEDAANEYFDEYFK